MRTLGLGLEGRVGLGRWGPVRGGSRHVSAYGSGPVLGTEGLRVYKGRAAGRMRGEDCPWDALERVEAHPCPSRQVDQAPRAFGRGEAFYRHQGVSKSVHGTPWGPILYLRGHWPYLDTSLVITMTGGDVLLCSG